MNDFFEINKKMWDKRAEMHVDSEFYDMKTFEEGRNSLPQVDQELLGDLKGKRVLHLQCHFGQDSLSMARMGAEVTGIDLSPTAIERARGFSEKLGIPAEFVCCNVLDIDQHLEGKFDIIYTSYGVIGWLPELTGWGKLIAQFLKPGGRFILAEFHPVVWMFDDNLEKLTYSYFNREMIIEEEEGSYGDKESGTKYTSVCWNHGLAEVFAAIFGAGLSVVDFGEYDYSPWDCFSKTVKTEKGYQIKGLEGKLPLMYTLVATK